MTFEAPEIFIHRYAFILTDDPARVDPDALARLVKATYWGRTEPIDRLRAALEGSHPYAVFAPDGSLAGCVRITSDGVYNARISDLLILEPYRGRGLGRWIMATLLYSSRFKNVRNWQLATDDAQRLYRRFGFEVFEMTAPS